MRPLFQRQRATPAVAPPALIAWSAPRFRGESLAELARADPGVSLVRDFAGGAPGVADAFCIRAAQPLAPIAAAVRAGAIFTRHLQPVDDVVPVRFLEDVVAAIAAARGRDAPSRVDVTGLAQAHLRRVLRESVAPAGARGPALSALVADGWLYLGACAAEDLPSAWPGGAPRFPPERVSRAGAKLREALSFLDDLGPHPQALDLGAAPGGFTSVLLERGARVLAVDPARLDPALEGAPGLTFLRRYAAALDARDVPPLDILTCDIVTAPATAAALVRPFAARLAPGAPAVVTLKLRSKPAPAAQLEGAAALFAPELELVRVRHLAANRCEVTALLRRAR